MSARVNVWTPRQTHLLFTVRQSDGTFITKASTPNSLRAKGKQHASPQAMRGGLSPPQTVSSASTSAQRPKKAKEEKEALRSLADKEVRKERQRVPGPERAAKEARAMARIWVRPCRS